MVLCLGWGSAGGGFALAWEPRGQAMCWAFVLSGKAGVLGAGMRGKPEAWHSVWSLGIVGTGAWGSCCLARPVPLLSSGLVVFLPSFLPSFLPPFLPSSLPPFLLSFLRSSRNAGTCWWGTGWCLYAVRAGGRAGLSPQARLRWKAELQLFPSGCCLHSLLRPEEFFPGTRKGAAVLKFYLCIYVFIII